MKVIKRTEKKDNKTYNSYFLELENGKRVPIQVKWYGDKYKSSYLINIGLLDSVAVGE